MKSLYYNRILVSIAVLPIIFLLTGASDALGISLSYNFDNGIRASIFTPETIKADMTVRDEKGRLIFKVNDLWSYEFIEDIQDPDIVCHGDGYFHSHQAEHVISALRDVKMYGAGLDIEIEVYILPLPRRDVMVSSTCGTKIFLSPGVFDIRPEVSAYLTTHELGHCVHNVYLPISDSQGWSDFLAARGLEGDPDFSFDGVHCNNPKEIFAEDFRFLFGGEAAVNSGTIENHNLALPDMVPGLEEFFIALVGGETAPYTTYAGNILKDASNYPNPFNPVTTIRAVFDDKFVGSSPLVEISVYDARGALVSTPFRGRIDDNVLEIRWEGRSSRGDALGSGVYFYRISSGGLSRTGKMLLVR